MIRLRNKPFAALCYRYRSAQEMQKDLQGIANVDDCNTWGLTAEQWREQFTLALKG